MPSINRNEKVTCENCGVQIQSEILLITGRVVLLVHCIVQNVPISLKNQEKILITILPKTTVFQGLQ